MLGEHLFEDEEHVYVASTTIALMNVPNFQTGMFPFYAISLGLPCRCTVKNRKIMGQ